jgi:hypothetical protein
MAWLLREGDVLAAVDETDRHGLRPALHGAVVKRGLVMVHTFNLPGSVDLAWCAQGATDTGEPCLEVRRMACLAPRRVGRPLLNGGALIVAEGGAFERWNLHVGDRLEIKET